MSTHLKNIHDEEERYDTFQVPVKFLVSPDF